MCDRYRRRIYDAAYCGQGWKKQVLALGISV